MRRKIRVAILFGGRSAEHEVSVLSAKNIIEAIDKEKYEPVLIGIDKKGCWYLTDSSQLPDSPALGSLHPTQVPLALRFGEKDRQLINLATGRPIEPIDVVFPVLHGPFGEDGTVQGLLKLADIPFVGPGVLASGIGMDKDVSKRLLRDAGIPVVDFVVFTCRERDKIDFNTIEKQLATPLFVKPCNMGSSVAISKVHCQEEFEQAVRLAFQYDNKIMVEEYIDGREIECSVLGNDKPIVSVPGEILPQHEFYSYQAKYVDESGAILIVPVKLEDDIAKKLHDLALKTFKTLCCEGMARVDFFLKEDGQIIVSEINTIPGFTKISMYPRLWEASGISYPELTDRLICLAIERFERDRQLKTDAPGLASIQTYQADRKGKDDRN
jgi:D-alanine-D-alanine ligase